jgi:NADPH:quinone reductase-like Zn-dependent oxidoreductase
MMKAAIYTKFGPPEVIQIKEIERPVPGDDEVLIRIYATTVEIEDPGWRKSRGFNGIIKPRHQILGMFLAGEIQETGKDVTRFAIGDKVYGSAGMKLGTCAEYKCMPEDGGLAMLPPSMSYEEAVAITNGALTALPFLREKANIKSGQKVLVNGASGSVGSASVQLAKYFGTDVTGVCSTANLDLVQSLGADKVIDYTKDDFTKNGETYDIIFDAAGKSTFYDCKNSLTEYGVYLTTTPTPSVLFHLLISKISRKKNKNLTAATGLRKPEKKTKDLNFLNKVIEEAALKAVIDRTYPLEELAEAHRYVEEGRKKGTVVISIK